MKQFKSALVAFSLCAVIVGRWFKRWSIFYAQCQYATSDQRLVLHIAFVAIFRKQEYYETLRSPHIRSNQQISKQKYFPQDYQNAQLNTSYPTKFILFPFFRLHFLFLFPLSWWFSSRIRFTNYEPRCYPNLRFNLSFGKQLVCDCITN
jgi:hypothetical protein